MDYQKLYEEKLTTAAEAVKVVKSGDWVDYGWCTNHPVALDKALAENPEKGEYFLPSVVTQLLEEGKARVKVLRSADKWYGVTYKEDKPVVVAAIKAMTESGLYPDNLWEV